MRVSERAVERRWRAGPSRRLSRERGRPGCGGRPSGLAQQRGSVGVDWVSREESGLGREGSGLGWGLAAWAGLVFHLSGFFSFLFLNQTKFEFKYKFEFKPHSNN